MLFMISARVCAAIVLLFGATVAADELGYPFDTDRGSPTCPFGCYAGHSGSDWTCDEGTSIYSSISGTVEEIVDDVSGQTCYMSFGNYVKIQNAAGDLQTVYAHLLQGSISVTEGAFVQAGQLIAKSSNTGYTLKQVGEDWVCQQGGGQHLHLEVRVNIGGAWTPVDPYTYNGGMWTNPLRFGVSIESLFENVIERNGGEPTVGHASGGIYSYGDYGYLRQDFSAGTFGPCCIMYDPNNGAGNELATNEAYLIRTGFYDYYQAHGGSALGCPTRDEYSSRDPEHWDQSTEYPLQNFFDRGAYENNEASQHYMIWKNGVASYHSAYATSYVSQNPSGQFTMQQGESRLFTVQFRNTGSNTWYNTSSHLDAYVELKSCNDQGATCESFLNYPYDGSLGWFNNISPCTMQESSVAPGEVATFTFTGRVDASAATGLHLVYFRVNHSVGGLLDDWGGMHFQVMVLEVGTSFTELAGDFNGDGKTDVALHNYVGGTWSVALSTGSSFTLSEDYWLTSFGTGDAYVPFVGDFNNDGKDDVGLHKNTTGQWYVALSTGSSFNPTGTVWANNFGTSSAYVPIVGDFNNDGKDDVGLHKNTGEWYVALSTGSSFNPTGTVWASSFGTGSAYIPIVGDFNNDGKDDVGLHKNTTGQWYVALNTGSSFNPTGSVWADNFGTSDAYTAIVGDFNEDGKDDVGLHKNTGEWYVAFSTGSAFSPTGTTWATSFGTSDDYIPIVGDFNEDGKDDVGLHKYTTGQWYGALNTGSSFDPTGTVWLSTYSIEFGGSEKIAVEEDLGAMPTTLSLSQNYPNPFNPTTTIGYSLPKASHVTLTVYNILGQKVAILVDEDQVAGEHSLTWDANKYSSGIYLYRIEADGITSSKKMLLLK